MDLNEYFYPLKKWLWLLIVATVVAGGTSFIVGRLQPSLYQSRTTLMVGQTIENPNPNSGDFYLEQSLAGVYADMAFREPVRNATMDALGLTWLPDYVSQPVPNSQFLEIVVTDSNPTRAQMVATELANQLIQRSPDVSQTGETDRQSFLNGQLDSLQSQITSTENDILTLQKQLGELNSAKQISDTQSQINNLQSKLASLQGNYANLLSSTQKGAINSLTVVEPAEVPSTPINGGKLTGVLLAAIIGLVLAAAGAYGIEFFDRTLKTEADIKRVMKLPVIGYISEIADIGNEWNYFMVHPHDPMAQSFRFLRGNIDFNNPDDPLKTICVSSVEGSSGKTTISTNLALAFLSGGKRVILLDGDPFRPRVHELLNIPIEPGLTDVLTNQMDVNSIIRRVDEVPDLRVITAGRPVENSVETGFWKIDRILNSIKDQADIIIIDGPPIMVPDGSTLASKVDGVLMILRPGRIRPDKAKAALDQLHRAKAKVLGVVLNRISREEADVYAGYSYYSPYHTDSAYFKNEPEKAAVKGSQQISEKVVETLKKTLAFINHNEKN